MSTTNVLHTKKPKAKALPKEYSLLEYLEREENTLNKYEFFNGKLRKMPGASYNHNQIASNVVRHLGNQLDPLEKDYRVLNSDQKVLVEAINMVLYPDALVICEKPKFWNKRTDLLLNPMVIVEVASKSTRTYDRGDKFFHYQLIPSFQEYVLIEQDRVWIEAWYRQDEETWKTTTSKKLKDKVFLKSLGVELDLEMVYRHIEF